MRRSRREIVTPAEAPLFEEIVPAQSGAGMASEGASASGNGEPAELRDLSQSLESIPLDWDDWEFEEDLRTANRRMHGSPKHAAAPHDVSSSLAPFTPTLVPQRRAQREPQTRQPKWGQIFFWLVLSLGIMPLVCGVVLVGWSYFSGADELWRIGIPLALAGQTGWLIGLLLQLDGLWQRHRRQSQSMEALETQLRELQETTTWMSAAHSGDARSFYAHLADGAGPSLLLADLKGQLDLLAMQLARQRAA
jgi:hypothetical protein